MPNEISVARILQHPNSPVNMDYPQTAASIERAKRDAARELIALDGPTLPTADEFRLLDAGEAIQRLATSLGSYRRLAVLVRNLAHIHGEEV